MVPSGDASRIGDPVRYGWANGEAIADLATRVDRIEVQDIQSMASEF